MESFDVIRADRAVRRVASQSPAGEISCAFFPEAGSLLQLIAGPNIGPSTVKRKLYYGTRGATGKTRTKTIMPSLHELRLPNLPSFRISVRSCCMLLSSTPSRAMDKSSQIISASRPCLPQSTQPVGTAPLALRAPPSLPVEMPHTTPKRTAMHCDTRMRHCKAKRHPGIPGAAQHKCRLSKAQ